MMGNDPRGDVDPHEAGLGVGNECLKLGFEEGEGRGPINLEKAV